jgi:DNA ligase D-like protein (predicted 3'-phosphoesterase)
VAMGASGPLRFVVNRHQATTLHFDLRLEVDGVLVSWAVPKGPSLDPAVKRLAIRVGDHDLADLRLEGRSQVGDRVHTKIVWDTGTYEPAEDPAPALDRGHLRFVLDGHKLVGGFALTRTVLDGHDRNWLLVKVVDEHVSGHDPTRDDNASVLSGVTNEELAEGSAQQAPSPESTPER